MPQSARLKLTAPQNLAPSQSMPPANEALVKSTGGLCRFHPCTLSLSGSCKWNLAPLNSAYPSHRTPLNLAAPRNAEPLHTRFLREIVRESVSSPLSNSLINVQLK